MPSGTRDLAICAESNLSGEVASWQARLPERSRYGIVQALRQTLEAACRWGYMSRNPAKLAGRNRQPSPRPVRTYSVAEVEAISAELSACYRPVPTFAAATGLRPEEWRALERRDVDRRARVANVLRTVSSGEVASWQRRTRPGGRSRYRAGRWRRSTRSRPASTRHSCFRPRAGGQ